VGAVVTERPKLLESIANTTADYREGELPAPTPEHIERWVRQFRKEVQLELLRELDHVFKKTYLSKATVTSFLRSMVKSKKIAGETPCNYWASVNFLRIQTKGRSQREMLGLVDKILRKECKLAIDTCGKAGGDYVYVDDVMFSGSRVGNDLEKWIAENAPAKARVHIVVAAMHASGEYLVGKRLKKVIADSGKAIELKYWRIATVENRKYYKNDSEVLWPVEVPADAATQQYVALPQRFPLNLRSPGGKFEPFSSERGRQLLEREFLVAGVRIRGLSQSPKDILRPLGFSPFGVGFGSMVVTYRNCPNNCPLVLWWGDPEAISGPFHWYPLFQRKTYAQGADFDVIDS
jgi:hypothetical protein